MSKTVVFRDAVVVCCACEFRLGFLGETGGLGFVFFRCIFSWICCSWGRVDSGVWFGSVGGGLRIW